MQRYIVINKESGDEDSFNTAFEARRYLCELLSFGIAAYIITAPLWKV